MYSAQDIELRHRHRAPPPLSQTEPMACLYIIHVVPTSRYNDILVTYFLILLDCYPFMR